MTEDKLVEVTEEELDAAYAFVKELLLRKNHDYGDAWQKHGLAGVFVRLSDKALRLEYLSGGHSALVTTEKTQDTLVDIVGYGLLGLLYERQVGTAKLESDQGV